MRSSRIGITTLIYNHMKTIKTILASVLLSLVAVGASAQKINLPQVSTIVEIGDDDQTLFEVFSTEKDGQNLYYMSMYNVGVDGKILIIRDPISQIFLHLGTSLDEAIGYLENLKSFFDQEVGFEADVTGSLGIGWPKDEARPVHVCYRRFVSKFLEFTIEASGDTRISNITKSQLNSTLRSVKFYKKLHPKE